MNTLLSRIGEITTRFHLVWVAFYVMLFGASYSFASQLYHEYDEDQLPPGHIELLISKTEYQVGEPIEFTVINHFPTTVYVRNHCPEEPLNVYRWENERWVELHDKALDRSSCYTQERNVAIPPEGSVQYNFSAWPNLFKDPGVYRIALEIDHYSSVPFQDFVILKPAEVVEVMEPLRKQAPAPVPMAPKVIPTPVPVVVPEPEVVIEEPEVVEEPVEEEPEEEEEREEGEEEDDE
jgi:hypothetical protein